MGDVGDDINGLADRLVAAIEAGDVESVSGIYADDAVIWHNTDQVEQRPAENLLVLGVAREAHRVA